MRPFGYEPDRQTVRVKEADAIRDAAERVLNGESLASASEYLNSLGVFTPTGKPWPSNTLKRVLVSPRIAGLQKDGETKAPWPAILNKRTHQRLVKLLTDDSRRPPGSQTTGRVYLLTGGIARCGLCGHPLIARPNNDGKRGYVCSSGQPYRGCGKIRINADLIENDVVERVLARIMKPNSKKAVEVAFRKALVRVEDADNTIAESEQRLHDLGVEYADGRIGMIELRSARERLNERIRDARRDLKTRSALDDLTGVVDLDQLVAWWEGASLPQQRALLDVLVVKIEVFPAAVRGSKIYDPSRVSVTWR